MEDNEHLVISLNEDGWGSLPLQIMCVLVLGTQAAPEGGRLRHQVRLDFLYGAVRKTVGHVSMTLPDASTDATA